MVLGCKDNVCVLGRGSKGSAAAKALVWLTIVISVAVAVVVDFWVAWAAILFGTVLLVGISVARTRKVGHPTQIVIPAVLCLLSVALLIWSTPVSLGLPAEVSPSASHSWTIARQVLQDHPLFGSGPGTWIYDYSQHRSPAANLSQFWTIRFERGLSTFFTLVATVGIVGTCLWLILLLSAVVKSASHLVKERNDDAWQAYLTVFAGWATMAFIGFFYNFNFSHHFVFWLLLALLGSLVAKGVVRWDVRRSAASSAVLSLVFVVLAVGAVSVMWLSGQRLAADAKYSSAVSSFRANHPVQDAIDDLNAAVVMNKLNDVYYRNLSQAYLIRVGQELQSQASETRDQTVKSLIRAAVDTATKATQVAPANVDNWSNLAIVYQAIASFTPGADELAIKNFQEALKREPNNPVFYDEIGKIFILRSDAYRSALSSAKDQATRTTAQNNVNAELDKAAAALNQSIQVKQDYATAHYDLGIMYERQGRIKDAITKLEQVLTVNNKDVGVGFQLAILYYRNGEKDKAGNLLTQITQLSPTYANARWYLSVIMEEKGMYDQAIAQVKEVQKTNPDNAAVTARLKQLAQERDAKAKPTNQPLPSPVNETIKGPGQLNEVNTP
jgi:tetratricopeptide (TPR) repeat protein